MEARYRARTIKALQKIGDSEAVSSFLSKYGKVATRAGYSACLAKYFAWLKSIGVNVTPDELITDNLRCVYESASVDVEVKRHTDWLSQYVNDCLLKEGIAEQSRIVASSIIKTFYKRSDSPLFGDFAVSSQPLKAPPRALYSEDIRAVLKDMPLYARLPLLIEWQTGIEINRVMATKWGAIRGIENASSPMRLEMFGRKKHRQPYLTFLGRDSVEGLRLWLT
jgi:hypothetical protein